MTIIANTFTRYSAVGIREDLSNTIFQISPEETPFVSNMTKRRKITNTLFEWQTDSLAAAAANHHIDGDDLASFTAVVPTVRLGNYSQILRKDFIIADNLAGSLDLAGRRSSVAYNIAQNGAALKRDLEHNLCGLHHAAAAGSTSAARKTAPLTSWLTTNTSNGAGSGADPTLSGGIPNAGPVNGTQRVFTEVLLKPVIQSVFENGGSPKFLMVNPFNKVKVSGFAGIAEQRYMAPDGPTTIIGAADVYVNTTGVAA